MFRSETIRFVKLCQVQNRYVQIMSRSFPIQNQYVQIVSGSELICPDHVHIRTDYLDHIQIRTHMSISELIYPDRNRYFQDSKLCSNQNSYVQIIKIYLSRSFLDQNRSIQIMCKSIITVMSRSCPWSEPRVQIKSDLSISYPDHIRIDLSRLCPGQNWSIHIMSKSCHIRIDLSDHVSSEPICPCHVQNWIAHHVQI